MALTAPIDDQVAPSHTSTYPDDLTIIDDDITIIEDTSILEDPMIPFLVLGMSTWVAIVLFAGLIAHL